ncbi:response regulator transcription factor [Bifidobacterium oedipodis]|uniref:DNA-binding response regulator n=1 Tax=Bifidobacterium oedipodis TaxID=2675322 RepID=A0A7Y0EQ27_9BIFI|nr:response regulator transcription factor [Bifidobacterium sp. DSM 109957]NMM94300.1 DNA-binding response regulator [Bifidobacterium sp. DSM 109957]
MTGQQADAAYHNRQVSASIGIVDNDPWALNALASFLTHAMPDIRIRWAARCPQQALQLFTANSVDAVIVDMSLGDIDGVALTKEIRLRDSHTPIMGITAFPLEDYAKPLAQAGAQALVGKDDPGVMAGVLRQMLNNGVGQTVCGIPFESAQQAFRRLSRRQQSTDTLTAKEKQLIELCAQGKTSECIARELNLSAATVNNRFARICSKMGVSNRMQMVASYLTDGRAKH